MANSIRLYKYRPFSSWQDKGKVFDILSRERFWASTASRVNDPFEIRAMGSLYSRENAIKVFTEIELHQNPSSSREEAHQKTLRVLSGLPDSKIRQRVLESSLEMCRSLSNCIALCCFAGTAKSILMWSHYAASHRGLCIEVEPVGLEDYVYKVNYSENVPTFDVAEYWTNRDKVSGWFAKLLLNKAPSWEYEQEYRFMIFRKDRLPIKSQYAYFKKGSVKRVIFGIAFEEKERMQYMNKLKKRFPKIGFGCAQPAAGPAYGLDIVDENGTLIEIN